MFKVGRIYQTLNGRAVRIVARCDDCKGHETVLGSDNIHRYDRSTNSIDAGRVTGTSTWPESCELNLVQPQLPPVSARVSRALDQLEEAARRRNGEIGARLGTGRCNPATGVRRRECLTSTVSDVPTAAPGARTRTSCFCTCSSASRRTAPAAGITSNIATAVRCVWATRGATCGWLNAAESRPKCWKTSRWKSFLATPGAALSSAPSKDRNEQRF